MVIRWCPQRHFPSWSQRVQLQTNRGAVGLAMWRQKLSSSEPRSPAPSTLYRDMIAFEICPRMWWLLVPRLGSRLKTTYNDGKNVLDPRTRKSVTSPAATTADLVSYTAQPSGMGRQSRARCKQFGIRTSQHHIRTIQHRQKRSKKQKGQAEDSGR